uniref:Peroxiredoxin-5 n=1 Tax=Fopius arisanus TaxID=64838 RepID=A0A0C9RK24_9HYME
MTWIVSRAISVAGQSSFSCFRRSLHLSPKNMVIAVGDSVPDVDLFEDSPANKVNLSKVATGKKIIVFGVPGAFTPGCSKTHLPGFVQKADELKSKGISEIFCVSVNDPFVMGAWGKDHKADGKVNIHLKKIFIVNEK